MGVLSFDLFIIFLTIQLLFNFSLFCSISEVSIGLFENKVLFLFLS